MKNRKDNKKRNLRPGEYQKPDGRYEYRFTDDTGKTRSVYSFRLVPTDPGEDLPLRDMEAEILKGTRKVGGKRTFEDAFNDYILTAPCREHVRSWKKYWYELHIKDRFGSRDVTKITNSDIQAFYRHLGADLGYSASYIEEMHSIINGVFSYEFSNRRVLCNPAENLGRTLRFISPKKASRKKRALTQEEQEAFVWALGKAGLNKVVENLIRFLLGTGCRISEALSLQWKNVDFGNDLITIDHSFVVSRDEDGKHERYLSETKTEAGFRTIPMISSVKDVLLEVRGLTDSDYIFVNSSGRPYTRGNIDIMVKRIRENYNNGIYGYCNDILELPPISAHVLRRTFCTRLCENVSDTNSFKNIAEIMGHSNINVTLNVYTSIDQKQKNESLRMIEDKINIG